jgi:hypothetical protein
VSPEQNRADNDIFSSAHVPKKATLRQRLCRFVGFFKKPTIDISVVSPLTPVGEEKDAASIANGTNLFSQPSSGGTLLQIPIPTSGYSPMLPNTISPSNIHSGATADSGSNTHYARLLSEHLPQRNPFHNSLEDAIRNLEEVASSADEPEVQSPIILRYDLNLNLV